MDGADMGATEEYHAVQAPSALQKLLSDSSNDDHPQYLRHLALQIAHNLIYQHGWTQVSIHYQATKAGGSTRHLLPRPILSGLPPHRLYIHPDEQIELLQQQKDAGKKGMPDLRLEREWVLPSHLREKWTLRRFGEMFDDIENEPCGADGEAVLRDSDSGSLTLQETSEDQDRHQTSSTADISERAILPNKWRMTQPKRLLLATLDDDSTIVYYIVHDGIVKPRQN